HTRFSRDWRSDVCSSDLRLPHLHGLEGYAQGASRLEGEAQAGGVVLVDVAPDDDGGTVVRRGVPPDGDDDHGRVGPTGDGDGRRSEERRVRTEEGSDIWQ